MDEYIKKNSTHSVAQKQCFKLFNKERKTVQIFGFAA